jgi:membrane protein
MITKFFTTSWFLVKATFRELAANDPLRMAGATAFFSTFALPPILIIIVRTLGLIADRRTIGRELMVKLENTVGPEGSGQVFATVQGFRSIQSSGLVSLMIFIFLIFVATTLFMVIQSSLNQIWDIRAAAKKGLRNIMRTRLHSLAVILLIGVLFIAVIVLDGAQTVLGDYMSTISPAFAYYVNSAFNYAISILIVTVWFFVLFMYLPDGRPPWVDAAAGALITGILFYIGKQVLRLVLSESNIGHLYGTAGALVLLLLFVFYSSLILYFGAAFTKVWCHYRGHTIRAINNAAVKEP